MFGLIESDIHYINIALAKFLMKKIAGLFFGAEQLVITKEDLI